MVIWSSGWGPCLVGSSTQGAGPVFKNVQFQNVIMIIIKVTMTHIINVIMILVNVMVRSPEWEV